MHFLSNYLAPGHPKRQKWAQNEAEGEGGRGQKHKIVNNDSNNAIKVLKLHQCVI